jgi:hypothetical protein
MTHDAPEHWRCLHCGYLLTGLRGEPIRCPECGHEQSTAELREFYESDEAVPGHDQTVPAVAGGATVLFLLGVSLSAWSRNAIWFVVLALVLSAYTCARLGRAGGLTRSHLAALFRFQLRTGVLSVSVAGIALGAVWLAAKAQSQGGVHPAIAVALVALAILLLTPVWRLAFRHLVIPWIRLAVTLMNIQKKQRVEDDGR